MEELGDRRDELGDIMEELRSASGLNGRKAVPSPFSLIARNLRTPWTCERTGSRREASRRFFETRIWEFGLDVSDTYCLSAPGPRAYRSGDQSWNQKPSG